MTCPHGSDPLSCAACHSAETGAPSSVDAGVAATMVRAVPSEPTTEEVVAPEMPSEGGRIGRFVVVEAVGQGGMGVVFKAYDPALDRRVAVKLLRPGRGGSRDSGGTARLAREAQAMARLAHPNVVPVYDVGRFGESLFVAMEFVSGSTLHRWLAEQPRTWREVLAVCLQAGRGLEAAHAAGIVHRDFKPANVLVGEDGRARVTDFGLARSSREEPRDDTPATPPVSLDTPITLAGSVMGTPGYMAPEQYVGRASTPATDQYAFCVTLFEALYGRRPFEGTDLPTLTHLTQVGQVPPAPKGSPVPAWLHELVVQGLAPDPVKRHPSMTALLARLEVDPTERRRRWLRAATVATLALSVAGGLWVWPIMRAASCHRETDELASVWSGSRPTIEQAFLQSNQSFAAASWDFVSVSLDRFTEAWVKERHQACDDTLRKGERSAQQLTLRQACLDRRRVELSTLVRQLETASPQVVAQAATAVSRLTPVARCGNVEALEQRSKLPPAEQALAWAIEQQLAEGRVLVALLEYEKARVSLTAAVAAARELNDPQTLALALFEVGVLERDTNRFPAARPALDESVRLALASRDDRTALHGLTLLASVVGWRLDQPQVGLALVSVGRGLVPRVDDPMLEALLDEAEGDCRWRLSDNPGSLAAYQRALPLFEKVQGPNGLDVARMHSSIGWMLMEAGALTKAREAYELAKRSREGLLGADHPGLAVAWYELGELARELDDREAAITDFRRALELRRRSGMDAEVLARSVMNLARALVVAGRLAEATDALEQVAAELDRSQPYNRLNFERATSELLLAKGELPGALHRARAALEVDYDEPLARAATEGWLGHVLLAQGDVVAAREVLSRASAALERLTPGSTTHAQVLVDLATALERVERAAVARVAAERALQASLTREGNHRLKARAALLVARLRRAAGALEEAEAAARQAVSFATDADMVGVRTEAEALLGR